MITKEYKAPNPEWDTIEFTCEESGISILQYHLLNDKFDMMTYRVKEKDGESYELKKEVFDMFKKIIK